MTDSGSADFPRIDAALRRLLSGVRLVVGNPSPVYTTMLRSNLLRQNDALPPPRLLGMASTVAGLRPLVPESAADVLVATTSHLRDGCCVPLLMDWLRRPDPPSLLVLLQDESPPLPLAALLEAPRVAIVWEGSVGQGGLLRAVERLREGQNHLDPEAQRRIQAAQAIVAALTERERDVLALVAEGLTNRQIAERIVVAEVTARDHVQRILRKLELPDRNAAADLALRLGLHG
ncbi:MAG: LuxR C-terminal-related transcriptional regulator [Cyanobacteriota bacterium]|nr:LuxR C-terminal-related transcriptional regulator [Cyanobacteriota bacterium]